MITPDQTIQLSLSIVYFSKTYIHITPKQLGIKQDIESHVKILQILKRRDHIEFEMNDEPHTLETKYIAGVCSTGKGANPKRRDVGMILNQNHGS